MSDDFTTMNIRIEGSVQGCGFRDFAVREANARKLKGWVRNRADGSLEAVASGPTKEVEAFIAACMKGPAGARIQQTLKEAEPVWLARIQVNASYPGHVPLQSSPPSLLLNLPTLPPELEYRIVGHTLILRDMEANLIVDFLRGAIP